MNLRPLSTAVALCLLAVPALAGDPARDALLADYAAQAKRADASFAGFSAERGKLIYVTRHAEAKPDIQACAACHGDDPTKPGQSAKTGKTIEPMAVSANPKRFTSMEDVEKWFGRNCREVLGHECSALEKGDYITFLASR